MSLAHGLIMALRVGILVILFARIMGRRIPPVLTWSLLGLSVAVVAASALFGEHYGVDARIFWNAGRDAWEGRDPYARPEFVHPPHALPMFAVLSLMPLPAFLVVWTILGLLGYGLLAPLARAALDSAGDGWQSKLGPADMALLSAGVLLSVPVGSSLAVGQLAFVTTLAVFAAMYCRGRDRPMSAGVLLTVVSFKPTTLIPSLALFLRRRDARTWITLAACGLGLAFLVYRPADLFEALQRNLGNIRALGAPGGVNDYSHAGNNTVDLVTLDHALYHLGLRNGAAVTAAHFLVLAGLGLWLAWQLYRRPRLAHAPACSIIACYAAIFIYHRHYDMVLLTLPLVYALARGLQEAGRCRWVYRACAVGFLLVLFTSLNLLMKFIPVARGGGFVGRLAEALILPVDTWIVLAALMALTLVERRIRPGSPGDP